MSLTELDDAIQTLRVKEVIQPQDAERIQSLVTSVEDEYAGENPPDAWSEFKTQLDAVLTGVRDAETTEEVYEKYTIAKQELQ